MTEAPSFPPRPAPGTMTGAERLDEVAAILAAGMRRLILKDQVIKSQSAQRVSFPVLVEGADRVVREPLPHREISEPPIAPTTQPGIRPDP